MVYGLGVQGVGCRVYGLWMWGQGFEGVRGQGFESGLGGRSQGLGVGVEGADFVMT